MGTICVIGSGPLNAVLSTDLNIVVQWRRRQRVAVSGRRFGACLEARNLFLKRILRAAATLPHHFGDDEGLSVADYQMILPTLGQGFGFDVGLHTVERHVIHCSLL